MSSLIKTLLGASAILATMLSSVSMANAAGDGERIDVILSGLPSKMKIRSYQRLKELAGASSMRRLEMTRSELWSIDASRLAALETAAGRYRVKVMRVGAEAMPMMVPMTAEPVMMSANKTVMSKAMASPSMMGMTMMATPPPALMEHALTAGMDAPAGEAPPARLVLPIDSGSSVVARRERIEITKDGCIWHGVIETTGEPVTLMWWAGGRLSGSISHNGRMYNIRYMGADMHAVMVVDPNLLPPEHAPTPAMRRSGGDMRTDPLVRTGEAVMMRPARQARLQVDDRSRAGEAADALVPGVGGIVTREVGALQGAGAIVPPAAAAGREQVVIDLVVAYTKAAASRYTDITRDLIPLAIEEANQSFRNSGLGHVSLRLVHAYETGYVEKGEHFDHLWRLADKGDGIMEEIHRLRDEKRADVALLVVHDPIGCGLATRVAAEVDEAFAVIHHECAATTYTLAHEVGHIIGARHDEALDQGRTPYPFGHGYVHGKEWRTMMSYKQSCDNCPRLPVWSSPRVTVRGAPAGSVEHDNAEVIDREAKRVAGFR